MLQVSGEDHPWEQLVANSSQSAPLALTLLARETENEDDGRREGMERS